MEVYKLLMENQIINITLGKYSILPENSTKLIMANILKDIISHKKNKSHLFYKYQDFLLLNSPNEYLIKNYNLYQSIKYLLKITESGTKKISPFLLNRPLNKLITQKNIIIKQIRLANKKDKYFSHPGSTTNIYKFYSNQIQLKNNNSYVNEKTIDLDEKDFIQNGCLDFATGNEICCLLKNFNKFDEFTNTNPCMIYTKKKSPQISFQRAFSPMLNNLNINNKKDYFPEKCYDNQNKNNIDDYNNKNNNDKIHKFYRSNSNRNIFIKKFYDSDQNELKINNRLTFPLMKTSLNTAKFIYRKKNIFSKNKDQLQQQNDFIENQSEINNNGTKENEKILNNIDVKKIEIKNKCEDELPLNSNKINNLKIPKKSKSIKKYPLKNKSSNNNINNNMNININNIKQQSKIKINLLEYSRELRKSDLGIFPKYVNNFDNFILNLAKKKNKKKSKQLNKNKSNKSINFNNANSLNISKKNNNLINSKNYQNSLKNKFSKLQNKSKLINEKPKIINTKKLLTQKPSKTLIKSKNTENKDGDLQSYRFNSPISNREFDFFSSGTTPKSFNFKNRKNIVNTKNLNLLSFSNAINYNNLNGYGNQRYDMVNSPFKEQRICFKFKRNSNYSTKYHFQKSNTELIDNREEKNFLIENNNNFNSIKNNTKNDTKKLIANQNFVESIIESPKYKERLSCESCSTTQKKFNIEFENNKHKKYSNGNFSKEICDKIESCNNMYIYNYTTNIYKNDYNTVTYGKKENDLKKNKSNVGVNLTQKEIKIKQDKEMIKVNLKKNNNLNCLRLSEKHKNNQDNFMNTKHKSKKDASLDLMKVTLVTPNCKKKSQKLQSYG